MPHYVCGTEAQIGDMVKGHGYNVKHEIFGMVTHITPHAESCNIQVAHVIRKEMDGHPIPSIDIEYGEARAFEKVA